MVGSLPSWKRKVSGTREFPSGCGRSAPKPVPQHVDTEELGEDKPDKVSVTNSTDSLDNLVGKMMVTDDFMKIEGVGEYKPKWFSPQWLIDVDNVLKKRALGIRYPKRKVSVTREYPPFCGRNAPIPTEEELFKLFGGSKISEKREMTKLKERDSPIQGTGRACVREVNVAAQDGYSKKRKLVGVGSLPPFKTKSLRNSPGGGERASGAEKKNFVAYGKALNQNKGARVIKLKGNAGKKFKNSPALDALDEFQVIVPAFGPSSSGEGDIRNKVRETLRLFHAICRKLLQGEEAKLKLTGRLSNRIDILSSNLIKDLGKEVNKGQKTIGSVPGVEVGDEYQYRVELALVGLHGPYQSGIDYMNYGNSTVAISIVSSGGYADDLDSGDVLQYTGQGGNVVVQKDKTKQPEDQKLIRGNLALKNSISAKTPVRVIRGYKEAKISADKKHSLVTSYTHDGLYNVERYWQEKGSHGKLVYMFELRRIAGQPELAWKELMKKKRKVREGLCDNDISRGKELFPISAVNTIDDEKPSKFNYITKMKYPELCRLTPSKSCDCVGQCGNSQSCSCITKNGEFPYNHDGAIVEVKSLVYECGPSCKCPPSCYNRVSQHGIKIQLEIFKTESRGWGVRSLASIPSGTFICEYLGELLEDKEAEIRKNDEYLFDIGQNYTDCSVASATREPYADVSENEGFTIDAAESGNVGRFINHSCSPNLYAQNVLYDHEDKRVPHIMLFAADNIPPLQELTYHYNYTVDQYRDPTGNIRTKNCYCGSKVCTGRMY